MDKKPRKKRAKNPGGKSQPPSRAGYKSTYLPLHIWNMLIEAGEADQRSGAFMVRRACEKLLRELGYDLRTGKRQENAQ